MDITKRSLQPLSVLQYRPDMPWMNFLKLCRLASFGHGSPATTAVLDSLPPIAREDTLNSSQNCRTLASQTRHYPPLTGTPYHYGPLAPSEIRIVSLLPGSEGDDIHCKVEAVDFSHRYSDYTALSYSWGRSSTQKSFKIYINGREFVVLENLYNALMALRKPDDIHRLWIDKICINQNKNDEGFAEKKIRIPLMGRLYNQAQSVIIWLGAAGNDSDFVMQTMGTRDVDQIQTYRFFSAFTHFIQREWFSRTWVMQEYALNKADPTIFCGSKYKVSWAHFAATFLFTLKTQPKNNGSVEAHNSPPASASASGSGDSETSDETTMAAILEKSKQMEIYSKYGDAVNHSNVLTLQSIRKDAQDDGGRLEVRLLYNLLARTKNLDARMLHDKIYGVQGLVNEKLLHHLPVDYKKPLDEVYGNAVDFMLTFEEGAFIFLQYPLPLSVPNLKVHLKDHPAAADSWPSWVPVFSYKDISVTTLGDEDWALRYPFRPLHFEITITTRGPRQGPKPMPEFVISGKTLVSFGISMGSIDGVVRSTISQAVQDAGNDETMIRTLTGVDKHCRSRADALGLGPVDETWITEGWETLFEGYRELAELNSTEFRQAFVDLVGSSVPSENESNSDAAAALGPSDALLLDAMMQMPEGKELEQTIKTAGYNMRDMLIELLGGPASKKSHPRSNSPGAAALRDALRQTFEDGKQFFTITDAGIFGITLSAVKEGDILAFLFPPWHMPFILRPRPEQKDYFTMIGPAILPSRLRLNLLEHLSQHDALESEEFFII